MARIAARPKPTIQKTLRVHNTACPECARTTRSAYFSRRAVATLGGTWGLQVQVRCCHNPFCGQRGRFYRAEEKGGIALAEHEFGLDVMALVGMLRYRQHRSVPEIHQELVVRGLVICQRTVTNLLDRYDELLALHLSDHDRLRTILSRQKRVILAVDGLQPDVGHEVLWMLRDCLSGQVLLDRRLLSSTEKDLAELIEQVKASLPVPMEGVISDGQHSIRNAVANALPGIPHQLCHVHYFREAARPIYEADRHAKKEMMKRVRDIRPIEREVEGREDTEAQAIRGYCSAVRSAITDDGRTPLQASGLKLQERLSAVSASLASVEEKRGCRRN